MTMQQQFNIEMPEYADGLTKKLSKLWLLRITGCMDFIHRQKVSETESVAVFRSEKGDTYSVGSLRSSDRD
jgi:hypothetical protein